MKYKSARIRALFTVMALCAGLISPTFLHQAGAAGAPDSVRGAGTFDNPFIIPDDPEAVYQGARIVHNVTVNGQKGMRVHANFTVKYGYDVSCRLIAYFYYCGIIEERNLTVTFPTAYPEYKSRTKMLIPFLL